MLLNHPSFLIASLATGPSIQHVNPVRIEQPASVHGVNQLLFKTKETQAKNPTPAKPQVVQIKPLVLSPKVFKPQQQVATSKVIPKFVPRTNGKKLSVKAKPNVHMNPGVTTKPATVKPNLNKVLSTKSGNRVQSTSEYDNPFRQATSRFRVTIVPN